MKITKPVLVSTISIAVILAGSIYVEISLNKKPQINFTTVKRADITQGVKVDGSVQASQDLSLTFQQGGVVSEVDVKTGDIVKKGQVLVRLDSRDSSASIAQGSASLANAQANYQKVLSGATSADIDVTQAAVQTAQTALDNAKKNLTSATSQQNLNVKNALSALVNSGLAAIPATSNISTVVPIISGAYTGSVQGQYQIKVYSSGSGLRFTATGLENYDGLVSTAPVALGTSGLFIQFPSGTIYANDIWSINIPNTQASSYISNYNAYQSALQTQNQTLISAQSAVDTAQAQLSQAKASLELKQTSARPEDIASAKAQVELATAQLQTAQNTLSKSIITAPIDGVISSVDTKVGQNVAGSTLAPGPAVIKLISSEKFQITSYLSEADIGKITNGNKAEITLDSYGSGVVFNATVISIDPAATVKNGVSSYKTTLEFDKTDDRIKEGMSARVAINNQTDKNSLIIPSTAIIKKGTQSYVLAKQDNGSIKETQIQTGLVDLNGNVEVTSGLSEGQSIAAFGN